MIKVKIAKKYTTPQDPWVEIEFPITPDEWREKLYAIGSTGEYVIIDAMSDDNVVSNILHREDKPTVQELNYIAAAMMAHSNDILELAESYVYEMNTGCSWCEWINLLADIDSIEYYSYDIPDFVDDDYASTYEKFGYTLASNNGLYDALYEYDVTRHFDFHEYGEYNCDGFILLENGYYYTDDNVDWDYYTLEEIEEIYLDYKLTWPEIDEQATKELNMLLME